MNRPSRQNKSDRLISPGASADEIRCDFATAPFDAAATASERKWGIDRLVELVSTATAERYGSAMAKLNAAIAAADPIETAARAAVCIRGLAVMDAEATAVGHAPAPPQAWQCVVGGARAVIIRDVQDWPLAEAAHPGHRVYTMQEVVNAIEHYGPMVAAAKDAFPGATVTAIRERTKTEAFLDDEIPY